MRKFWAGLVGLGLVAVACTVVAARADRGEKKVDTRFFELRIYHVAPGKMQALQARFRDHTNKLLEKHGMTLIGFWTPARAEDADQRLYYIVAYPSKEEREKSWAAFRKDPDWVAAKKESEKDGPLVERVEEIYLNPTDFSAIK